MIEARRRPIEERIAALMGKSSFVDFRDGIGGTNPLRLRDSDVAAALGMVAKAQGPLSAMVLETYYGSTLLHSHGLLRAWDERERQPGQKKHVVCLARFAGELGIREFAGHRYARSDLEHYARLLVTRRETLQLRKADVLGWLDGIRSEALRALHEQLQEPALAA